MSSPRPHTPVLLLGAGTGEATCGILYLASHLRRNGIEAFVRLYDRDVTTRDMERSLAALIGRVKPRLVGISLKWFHHVHRAVQLARVIRKLDPSIRLVVGGNSATHWWRELTSLRVFDDVVLGDGEVPLLSICRGDADPPNCISRGADGAPKRLPLGYVQSASNTDDVFYSHFDEIFLSAQDLHAYSGWIQPGKGCGENCLYCGGSSRNQRDTFGRGTPYLRTVEGVHKDHAEVAPRAWQVRYDFSGSSAEFLKQAWSGVDLSHHACTYFLWGRPRPELVEALAGAFEQVYMVLDIGCFSESQRLDLRGRGMLKPCATNAELFEFIEFSRRFRNLEVEISGISGLPYASARTLTEERALVARTIELGCVGGYQRLEAQPGALVTEYPSRFDMVSEARTFAEFMAYFESRPPGDVSVPMVRFADPSLEAAVSETSAELEAMAFDYRASRRDITVPSKTRLVNTAPSTKQYTLAEWLGSHIVQGKISSEPVTVVRSVFGGELVCAPTLGPRQFKDATLSQGTEARQLLAALEAFTRPATVSEGVRRMTGTAKIAPELGREVVDALVSMRLLQPA